MRRLCFAILFISPILLSAQTLQELEEMIQAMEYLEQNKHILNKISRYSAAHSSLSIISNIRLLRRTALSDQYTQQAEQIRISPSLGLGLEYSSLLTSNLGFDIYLKSSLSKARGLSSNKRSAFLQHQIALAPKTSFLLSPIVRFNTRIIIGKQLTNAFHSSQWSNIIGCGIGLENLTNKRYIKGCQIDYIHSSSALISNRITISSQWKFVL